MLLAVSLNVLVEYCWDEQLSYFYCQTFGQHWVAQFTAECPGYAVRLEYVQPSIFLQRCESILKQVSESAKTAGIGEVKVVNDYVCCFQVVERSCFLCVLEQLIENGVGIFPAEMVVLGSLGCALEESGQPISCIDLHGSRVEFSDLCEVVDQTAFEVDPHVGEELTMHHQTY